MYNDYETRSEDEKADLDRKIESGNVSDETM